MSDARAIGDDPYRLLRFLDAQDRGYELGVTVYERAVKELCSGYKRTHWMWFVFPQHVDLGQSPTSLYYGITGRSEAEAYMDHPILLHRLLVATHALLSTYLGAKEILGPVDTLKLRSSMELFCGISDLDIFRRALNLAASECD